MEERLSKYSHRTNDAEKYEEFLQSKADVDKLTRGFYKEKWRNWKFCKRKSSEMKLVNRIKHAYGPDCTVYYGDWSRTDQMSGCDPSPVKGMRSLISKHLSEISGRIQDVEDVQHLPRGPLPLQDQGRKALLLQALLQFREVLSWSRKGETLHGQGPERRSKHPSGREVKRQTGTSKRGDQSRERRGTCRCRSNI